MSSPQQVVGEQPSASLMQAKKRRQAGPPGTTAHSAAKRSRTGGIAYSSTDLKLASIFDRLSDEVSDQRIGAAKELIEFIQERINARASDKPVVDEGSDEMKDVDSGSEGKEAEDESKGSEQLDTTKTASPSTLPSAQELVTKVLRRLVRGVCSGRKGARFGFSVALSEVLRLLYSPQTEMKDVEPPLHGLIDYVTLHTHLEGKTSGQERRDFLFGRLYACVAVMQSEILFHTVDSLPIWKQLLETVSKLAYDVPWLREECGSSLYENVKSLLLASGTVAAVPKSRKDKKGKKAEKVVSETTTTAPIFVQFLQLQIDVYHESQLFRTPEGIALWLLYSQSPLADQLTLPSDVWQDQSPLSPKERTRLAAIMREDYSKEKHAVPTATTPAVGEEPVKKGMKPGTWKSQPNFAWTIVIESQLAALEKEHESKDAVAEALGKFWVNIVDNNLFSTTTSDERKAWGLQILSSAILSCPIFVIPSLLSPNILKCIIHHRGSTKSYLHQAAATPLRMVAKRASLNPELAVPVLQFLLTRPECSNFDQVTKGHTIEKLLEDVTSLQLNTLVNGLVKVVNSLPSTQNDPEVRERIQSSVIESFVIITKSQVRKGSERFDLNSTDAWCVQMLEGFARWGFLSDAIPLRATIQARLNTILSSLLSLRQSALWPAPYIVVSYIEKAVDSGNGTLQLDADEAILLVLKKMNKTIKKIRKNESESEEDQKPIWAALNLLFSLTLLQVCSSEGDAIALSEDLLEFYNSMNKKSCDFTPLVEILLSLIAKQSVLFRKLAEQVFSVFTGFISADGLDCLLHILEKSENKAGMDELFQNEDELELGSDSEDDDDIEMVDGEDDSDVEVVDGNQDVDSDSDSDSDGSDAEGDDDKVELEKFNELLAQALQTKNPHGKDGVVVGDSDSEDGMDDDEMTAIDSQLSDIFKKQTGISGDGKKKGNPRKDAKQAKETVINFKNRSLDLLSTFLKQESHRSICQIAILPLIKLVRTASQPQLANKARDVLSNYYEQAKSAASRKNRGDKPEVNVEIILALLNSVHQEVIAALSSPSLTKMFVRTCSSTSLFLCRSLMGSSTESYAGICDLYADTQRKWVSSSIALPLSDLKVAANDEATIARNRAEKNQHLFLPFITDFANWSSDMIRESWKRQKETKDGLTEGEEQSFVSKEAELAEEEEETKIDQEASKKGKKQKNQKVETAEVKETVEKKEKKEKKEKVGPTEISEKKDKKERKESKNKEEKKEKKRDQKDGEVVKQKKEKKEKSKK